MAIRIRWLGHSSFQFMTGARVLYVDLKKYGKIFETYEKADIILVTHNHSDHCSPEKIEKLRKKSTVIIAPKNCAARIKGVKSLKPGEQLQTGGIKVTAVEAYNVKRMKPSGKPWHPKGYGVGYMITAEDKTIYHAGDTDLIPEMTKLGKIDLALIPTGDKYTMDNIEAAEAVLKIKPKACMPMHMWDTNPKDFRQKVETASNTKVLLLQEGQEYTLD